MQYADHHFVEDSHFYSIISKLASTLLSQSRWYPHPLLLYKTILYTMATNKEQQIEEGNKNQTADRLSISTKKETQIQSSVQANDNIEKELIISHDTLTEEKEKKEEK